PFSVLMFILLVIFFLLILRHPPISPLFPYTTLSDLSCNQWRLPPHLQQRRDTCSSRRSHKGRLQPPRRRVGLPRQPDSPSMRHRSEEHTSELQSRGHLVCRLLVEKK